MADDHGPDALPAETTVLIVGGGPVGLLMSILLDAQGIDNTVVERRHTVQASPAAHVINARTFEICRAAGLDMDRIRSACQRPDEGRWVRWVTSLTGDELGRVPFERQHELHLLDDVTPTPLRNLSQHRFEPILRDHVRSLASGVEWLTATHDPDGVVSTVRRVDTDEATQVRSRYLVAADGAGSPVRRWLGIGMDGPSRLRAFIAVHVEADLRSLVGERPATLYWVLDPDRSGILVAHDIARTWVFMHDWDPDEECAEDYDLERCRELFRKAVGWDDVPFTVRNVTPWQMSCQVADHYRDGRVFLVGDSAHRFPPTGGLGLNTGAVDAQNLAWKLGAVEHGWADVGLLDTYERERRPIAEANAAQSLRNAAGMFEVLAALGTTDDPVTTRENYLEAISTDEGRNRVRVAAEGQAEHFDMLGLQLGFAYGPTGGLVLDDGTPPCGADDPVRQYRPTTRPGGRLPHAWVERDGRRVSTLDLVPLDRFVLLTSSTAWAAAAEELSGGDVPLDVVLMGREVLDPGSRWAAVSELGVAGAVLVRPDQHVAWRATGPSPDPAGELRNVLRSMSVATPHG